MDEPSNSLSTPNLDVSSASRAIDTGVALGSARAPVDSAGNPRIVNGQINIGAWQP